tara:strand:- start:5096 stop:5278 length:183 start_codon:yes stop_codon:yes gene_type:complete
MINDIKKNKEVLILILILSIFIITTSSCNRSTPIEVNRITPVFVDEDSTVYYNTNKKGLE